MHECTQSGCTASPIKKVHWPGKNPVPTYCQEHADKAVAILSIMGIQAVVEDLPQESASASDANQDQV